MPAPKLTRRIFWTAEVLLMVGTVCMAVQISRPEEWRPPLLVALLLVFAVLGEKFNVDIRGGQLGVTTVVLVLAMGLFGPGPAAACGIAAMTMTSAKRRLPPAQWLNNLCAFTVPPLAGGLTVRALASHIPNMHSHDPTQSVIFCLIVFAAFLVLVVLNLLVNGLDIRLDEGRSFARQMREYIPLLPAELTAGALATILAVAYVDVGLPVLLVAIALLLIFRHLVVALLRSEDRAEQLEARSIQLVGLQLGILRTLVRALSARDETIGQHAGAVARYAKALASEIGCGEAEQEVVHTASLLHDIGKFAWPDRILHADVIKDEDMAIVKNHAQEGAVLVGALDGYGEVADAILYHHERIDGGGYPAGLIGSEIPLTSRILAICSTYDTMTTSHAYQAPMTAEEAMDELRHAAGHGQFDAELVERFIAVLEREGPTFGRETGYETELDFERRVREMAAPRPAARATRSRHAGPVSSVSSGS